MLTAFKKIFTSDKDLTDVQGNIDTAFRAILECPLLPGVLISGISLKAGQANSVSHQLQRIPVGFLVVDNKSNSTIWREDNTTPGLTLTLRCSADTTASFYVF